MPLYPMKFRMRFQTSLAPFGLALFSGDAIMTDRSFTLLQCLNVYKSDVGVINFIDDHISRTLDVRLLLPPGGRRLKLTAVRVCVTIIYRRTGSSGK